MQKGQRENWPFSFKTMNKFELHHTSQLLQQNDSSWLKDSELQYDKVIREQGLFFPNSSVLPVLLPKHLKPRLEALAKTLHHALKVESARFFAGNTQQNLIQMPKHFQQYIRALPEVEAHPIFRVDLFFGENFEDLKILELNCSDPSGLGFNEMTIRGARQNQSLMNLAREHQSDFTDLVPRYVKALLSLYKDHCRRRNTTACERPKFVLLVPQETFFYSDVTFLRDAIRREGFDANIVEPKGCVYDPYRTDTIYIRDSLWDFIDEQGQEKASAALKLLNDPALFCMNPTASYFGEQKSTLSVLGKHCPEIIQTRIFASLTNEEIRDLQENKNRYVLKPTDEYGGHGVVLGIEATQTEWEHSVRSIAEERKPFVVQSYVPADTSPFFKFEEGKVVCHEVPTCYSFWVFNGEFAGAFARKSKSKIINVHQGGAFVPVLFL